MPVEIRSVHCDFKVHCDRPDPSHRLLLGDLLQVATERRKPFGEGILGAGITARQRTDDARPGRLRVPAPDL